MGFVERLDPDQHHGELFYLEHMARYRWAEAFARGRMVLDVACGTGYGSRLLAEAGARFVASVDVSPEALTAARQRFGHERAAPVRADAVRLPFGDASFDLVVSFETIEHLPEPERLVAEMRRVLRREGLVVVSSPNRAIFGGKNPFHPSEMTVPELRRKLAREFPAVHLVPQFLALGSQVDDRGVPGVCAGEVRGPGPEAAPYVVAVCGEALPDALPSPVLAAGVEMVEKLRLHIASLEGGVAQRDASIARLEAALRAERVRAAAGAAELVRAAGELERALDDIRARERAVAERERRVVQAAPGQPPLEPVPRVR
ncbi:MAG TPA: class I SAM-dependent methyltransferase [Anaeromyxobacteraceae bacterium]|jgi:SAM-dependent methyltransferase